MASHTAGLEGILNFIYFSPLSTFEFSLATFEFSLATSILWSLVSYILTELIAEFISLLSTLLYLCNILTI